MREDLTSPPPRSQQRQSSINHNLSVTEWALCWRQKQLMSPKAASLPPNTTPHPPSCITAGSVNCLAAPWRNPRSAVSEWTKWRITPLRCVSVMVCVCDRWRQVHWLTRCSIRCCWGQRLLPSAGVHRETWTVNFSAMMNNSALQRVSSTAGKQEHDESQGSANGMLHKSQSHKRNIFYKGQMWQGDKSICTKSHWKLGDSFRLERLLYCDDVTWSVMLSHSCYLMLIEIDAALCVLHHYYTNNGCIMVPWSCTITIVLVFMSIVTSLTPGALLKCPDAGSKYPKRRA